MEDEQVHEIAMNGNRVRWVYGRSWWRQTCWLVERRQMERSDHYCLVGSMVVMVWLIDRQAHHVGHRMTGA